jgi:predicted unusual protein kinase regulating ubiquinone biosynthesis (AarF/ABC1/UbiB family)
VPLYRYGIIHGDPHLGNYTVRPDDLGINLLDFGCIRIFPPRFVQGSIDLYRALRDDDEELAVEAYRNWGFRDIGRETIAILNDWASFIYGPLMEPGARRIQMGDTPGAYGRERAAKVHQALRRVGGITIPREFVLMDRAAVGLGSVFLHMNAEVDWHALFHELVGDFDVDALARRQAEALAAAGLEIPAENG